MSEKTIEDGRANKRATVVRGFAVHKFYSFFSFFLIAAEAYALPPLISVFSHVHKGG